MRMDTPETQSTVSDRDWFRIGAAMRLRLGSLAILDEPLRVDIGIAKEESAAIRLNPSVARIAAEMRG